MLCRACKEQLNYCFKSGIGVFLASLFVMYVVFGCFGLTTGVDTFAYYMAAFFLACSAGVGLAIMLANLPRLPVRVKRIEEEG